MKKLILFLFNILIITTVSAKDNTMSIYDFRVKDIDAKDISMSKYKNKTLLIVNVASKCGFTPQYEGLENLYQKYKNKDFMILAFPSNQFSEQEPETNDKIKFFCTTTYDIHFDMFSKIDVNGDNTIPLYKYLKKEQTGFLWTESIKWNFTKFLVDKKGNVIKRYGSSTKSKSIENDIEKLLGDMD